MDGPVKPEEVPMSSWGGPQEWARRYHGTMKIAYSYSCESKIKRIALKLEKERRKRKCRR